MSKKAKQSRKIEMFLTIGYQSANRTEEVDIVEDLGLDVKATDGEISDAVREWADQFIESGWKEVEEDDDA